jgi:hypothetical protein
LPLLRPDRFYLFCIRTTSAPVGEDSVAFVRRVQRNIDNVLRPMNLSNDLDNAQVRALQTELVNALPAAPPGGDIDRKQSSIFDLSQPLAQTQAQLQTRDLADAHGKRTDAIGNVSRAASQAEARLADVGRDYANELRTLAASLRNPISDVGEPATRHTLGADAARLLAQESPPDFFERIAGGQVTLTDEGTISPLVPFAVGEMWDSSEVDVPLRNLAATQERLAALRTLASVAAANPRAVSDRSRRMPQLVAALDILRSELSDVQRYYGSLQQSLVNRKQVISSVATNVVLKQRTDAPLIGSSIETSLDLRSRRYFTADVGLLYAFLVEEGIPYLGVNYYPRALNRRVPQSVLNSWDRSLGFMAGLTLGSLAKEGERDDLFGSTSGVLGVGFRFADVLRVSGGGVFLRDLDNSATEEESHLSVAPFLSLSFDWDARGALGKLGDVLSK